MNFKAFTCSINGNSNLTLDRFQKEVNQYIKEQEVNGFSLKDKTVHVTRKSDNALIDLILTITIWMA